MFTTGEIISIVLGILSVIIAIGLSCYFYHLDKQRRNEEEAYFSEIIKHNIEQITKYYVHVENISQNDRNDDETEISKDLNDYYVKKIKEMKDLISYTNLYLTQWKSLKIQDKKIIEIILKKFSWLVYDYYPTHLPLETCNRLWQSNTITLSKNKEDIIEKSEIIHNLSI